VPSPVKTSIKGRGCNSANNCDATATRVPCCKVAKEEEKKSGLSQKEPEFKDGYKGKYNDVPAIPHCCDPSEEGTV